MEVNEPDYLANPGAMGAWFAPPRRPSHLYLGFGDLERAPPPRVSVIPTSPSSYIHQQQEGLYTAVRIYPAVVVVVVV